MRVERRSDDTRRIGLERTILADLLCADLGHIPDAPARGPIRDIGESEVQGQTAAAAVQGEAAGDLQAGARVGRADHLDGGRCVGCAKLGNLIPARIEHGIRRTVPLLVVVPALWSGPGLGPAVVLPRAQRSVALIFLRREELAGQFRLDVNIGIVAQIVGHDTPADIGHRDHAHELIFQKVRVPAAEIALIDFTRVSI